MDKSRLMDGASIGDWPPGIGGQLLRDYMIESKGMDIPFEIDNIAIKCDSVEFEVLSKGDRLYITTLRIHFFELLFFLYEKLHKNR